MDSDPGSGSPSPAAPPAGAGVGLGTTVRKSQAERGQEQVTLAQHAQPPLRALGQRRGSRGNGDGPPKMDRCCAVRKPSIGVSEAVAK